MTDIKRLAELAKAAHGWLDKAHVEQEDEDGICLIGSNGEEGEFYSLIELDCENYGFSSRPLAEYIIAACNSVPSLIEQIEALSAELESVRADAERYRWLRKAHHDDTTAIGVTRERLNGWGRISAKSLRNKELDAAVDAARKVT